MYLDLSPLFLPVCEYFYVCIGHETHESACNVESRPFNCWDSVSTASPVGLTSDVFEIICAKRGQQRDTPGTVKARPRPPPTQSKWGSKMREFRTEGESSSRASTAKAQKYVQEKLRSLLRAAAAINLCTCIYRTPEYFIKIFEGRQP